MTVIDLWVNALSAEGASAFVRAEGNAAATTMLGSDLGAARTCDDLIATMDANGVDHAIVATGLTQPDTPALLETLAGYGGRLRAALVADAPNRALRQLRALRELGAHPNVALLRITPLVHQLALNHRLYYPLYATAADMELAVSINVGIPGPQVRSACQDPVLLEDVLIDFPKLVVIGAHMGHPYEPLLIQYMLKWPNLYLSNSAYLARYMDADLVRFMDSSRGRGRVLFASDHPFLPMDRAIGAARALEISDEAKAAFLGDSARQLLWRD